MITAQEHRDQDYLEGYGVGLAHTLSHQELTGHTLAFVRGYRDAREDFNVAGTWSVTMQLKGGEPA